MKESKAITALNDLADAQRRKIRTLQGRIRTLERQIAAAPETAVAGENSQPAGAPKVLPECYNGRYWLLRSVATGRIVAYPGSDLGHVARSWLAYELADDGDQVATLAALEERVQAAERRIVNHLKTLANQL
jgi:hypothetical protein